MKAHDEGAVAVEFALLLPLLVLMLTAVARLRHLV